MEKVFEQLAAINKPQKMKKNKIEHTAGKWELLLNDSPLIDNSHLIECNGKMIAHVESWEFEEKESRNEGKANAKLIAAAPTMMDALQSILTTFEAMVTNPEIEAMKWIAQMALDKATK